MATPAEELDVDGVKVRLTNPDKVYFPKLGSDGTKRKLVEYYLAVACGPMLTALRDRPTHLQRFPDFRPAFVDSPLRTVRLGRRRQQP